MKLASHNSWSYLTPKKWWMKLFAFTARCQRVDIKTQYEVYGVRCFDLRLKFKNGESVVVHNRFEYNITKTELIEQLQWLNSKKDVAIRILLDVRTKKAYTEEQREYFFEYCDNFRKSFKSIKFWCGRNLFNWDKDYIFHDEPTVKECYASVCDPTMLDDWYPWLFAKYSNKVNKIIGTECEYLMLDFVDYE